MVEKINRIQNPLTVIAIFAALAEINATVAISLIDKNLHHIFIWFIIGFPTILILAFFLTLNFNTKVIYAPSDYKDDQSFMNIVGAFYGGKNDYLQNVNSKDLSVIEENISNKLQEGMDQIIKNAENPDISKNLAQIKIDLEHLTKKTVQDVKETVHNTSLRELLLSYIRHPANLLLIATVIKGNITSTNSINDAQTLFKLPSGWKIGVERLLNTGILLGTEQEFKINPEYHSRINNWVNNNEQMLNDMSDLLRSKEIYINENKLGEWESKTLSLSIALIENI